MTAPLLELTSIRASYGDLQALFDISLEVREGEIVTLIGANGAGKTTTLRVISGSLRATGGTVKFDGRDITSQPAHTMPLRGISHVPEGRQLFPYMTVEENLDLGAYNPRSRPRARAALDEQLELFPRLNQRTRHPVVAAVIEIGPDHGRDGPGKKQQRVVKDEAKESGTRMGHQSSGGGLGGRSAASRATVRRWCASDD